MIKYILLVCLITAPLAQTPEAVVTHYDLEGNLIQIESSLQGSEDINSMNSMNMNQQDIHQTSMDLIGTDSIDYFTQETESIQSSNIESSMNQESTVNNMNIDSNSIMNTNLEKNSMPDQDSMYSISDPNDINAIEQNQQNMDNGYVIENTEFSNIAEVNSDVVSQINSNNMIAESNKISNTDLNNIGISQDNQIDVINILESNVEYPTNNNNNFNQNQVDPNIAFDILTKTDSLQSSPQLENEFAQSEINTDNQDTENIEENQTEVKVDNQDNNEKVDSVNNLNTVEEEDTHNTKNNNQNQQLQESASKTNKSLVQGNCIIIYSECNFKGESLEACNSLSEIQEFEAQIRSIYIPEGLGLTVYDGENFTGRMHKFKSSQECLTIPLSFAQLDNPINKLKGQNLRFRQ